MAENLQANASVVSVRAFVYKATQTMEELPAYDGEYTIKPKTEEQKLETKNKKMIDDVTITPIPYYEISNTANGETAIIGE